jgi:hypothetical protein
MALRPHTSLLPADRQGGNTVLDPDDSSTALR